MSILQSVDFISLRLILSQNMINLWKQIYILKSLSCNDTTHYGINFLADLLLLLLLLIIIISYFIIFLNTFSEKVYQFVKTIELFSEGQSWIFCKNSFDFSRSINTSHLYNFSSLFDL